MACLVQDNEVLQVLVEGLEFFVLVLYIFADGAAVVRRGVLHLVRRPERIERRQVIHLDRKLVLLRSKHESYSRIRVVVAPAAILSVNGVMKLNVLLPCLADQ